MTAVFVKNAIGAESGQDYSALATHSRQRKLFTAARNAFGSIPCAQPAKSRDAGTAQYSASSSQKLVGGRIAVSIGQDQKKRTSRWNCFLGRARQLLNERNKKVAE